MRYLGRVRAGPIPHRISGGATTSAPPRSPSHHVHPMAATSSRAATPPSSRLVTPNVALTGALATAAISAKRNTLRGRSKARTPSAQRMTSAAPITASSVLPTAMPRQVATELAVAKLTAKAPARIRGQTRRPKTSTAARATPVAGHTAVALGWTKASMRPSLPATT
jgi:hypothetical protein